MSFCGVHLSFQQTWSTKSHKRWMTLNFDQTYVCQWRRLQMGIFLFFFPPPHMIWSTTKLSRKYTFVKIHFCGDNQGLWELKVKTWSKCISTQKLAAIKHARLTIFMWIDQNKMWQTVSLLPSALSWQRGVKAKKTNSASLVNLSPCLLWWSPFCEPFVRGPIAIITDNEKSEHNWLVRNSLLTNFPIHHIHQPIFFFQLQLTFCFVLTWAFFLVFFISQWLASQKACPCTCEEHAHISTLSYQGPISLKVFLIFNIWGESWLSEHSLFFTICPWQEVFRLMSDERGAGSHCREYRWRNLVSSWSPISFDLSFFLNMDFSKFQSD